MNQGLPADPYKYVVYSNQIRKPNSTYLIDFRNRLQTTNVMNVMCREGLYKYIYPPIYTVPVLHGLQINEFCKTY